MCIPARVAAIICLEICCSAARADDPRSGPQSGETVEGFEFEIAAGDDAGKTIDPLEKFKDKPLLMIFEGQMTRPGFGLIRVLDKYGRVRQAEGLEVLIIRVGDDNAAAAKHARLLYDMYDVKATPGVTTTGGKLGPKGYNLSDDVEMTVLLVNKERKVLYNVARRAPERQDFDDIRKAIDKLLGPSPVPFSEK
jgi:hypothetical protein